MPELFRSFGMGLFPVQAKVYQKIIYRISDGKPSLLWAGMQAGKTTVCREVSGTMESMPQIVIGNSILAFQGFHVDEADFITPERLPLQEGWENEMAWEYITPFTLVFIDDLFHLPNALQLYERICSITPHVVAMGQIGDTDFPVGPYIKHLIGPYATWEMNPLLNADVMRTERERMNITLDDRRQFNNDVVACVDAGNWDYWVKDDE